MSQVKLFGNSRSAARVARGGKKKDKKEKKLKKKKPLKTLAIVLTVLLCIEGLYFFCIYSQNSFVRKWRNIYIQTAMSTMRHQWLATYFIPGDVIDEVLQQQSNAAGNQIGIVSTWGKTDDDDAQDEDTKVIDADIEQIEPDTMSPEEQADLEKAAFYELFWELDQDTMQAYIDENPQVLDNGWSQIYINEAGFDDDGTSIMTTMGEQVLAIDAANQILLVRVEGSGYRGVLAVAKDPSQLSIEMSEYIGTAGQLTGEIAEAHDGVLAMVANGFIDVDAQGNQGNGNGGIIAGYTMSNGESYGSHFGWGYKRIELHEDNRFYIMDASDPVSEDCTDATEFQPALIIDGETFYDGYWTMLNPRACIGQSDKYEILMLVIEGRMLDSVGTDVNTCTGILERHNCMQAMNVDGGTSAMMWFDGEYVIRCSNANLRYTGGRTVPNAFVYKRISD